MAKSVVLLSGGADSAVALALAKQEHPDGDLVGLFVDYRQRCSREERRAAHDLCRWYAVDLAVASVSVWKPSAMLQGNVLSMPLKPGPQDFESAEIPFRNGVLLALATAVALDRGATEIWIGTHPDAPEWKGPRYADVSAAFLSAMHLAMLAGRPSSEQELALRLPFSFYERPSLINLKGQKLGVPWHLTYSCFMESGPCGECPKCKNRAERFAKQNLLDTAQTAMRGVSRLENRDARP